MTGLPPSTARRGGSLSTIRVRLAAALAAALLPVLILGVAQSAIAFNRERVTLRQNLGFAAERSAATARTRMEGAGILLQTLAPGAVGTVKSRVSRARRALHAILEDGSYDRDGASAGDAMRAILADAERLSTVR